MSLLKTMLNRIIPKRAVPAEQSNTNNNKLLVGNLEVCDLPELGITNLELRVDTGATTSSLHVDNLVRVRKGGKRLLRFDIHPDVHQIEKVTTCRAPVHSIRRVKSSNGTSERRYVIKTTLKLDGESWPIELSLTDRSDMNYLMLLGREGMSDRLLVDPSQSFLLNKVN